MLIINVAIIFEKTTYLLTMKHKGLFIIGILVIIFFSCEDEKERIETTTPSSQTTIQLDSLSIEESTEKETPLSAHDIILTKDFLYDQYTLEDNYPYKDTLRSFKWAIIKQCLAFIENMQESDSTKWVVLQNYKNINAQPPLVKKYIYNKKSKSISDTLGVARSQSIPLYLPNDTITPEIYAYDGSLARLDKKYGNFQQIKPILNKGLWLTPSKYLKELGEDVYFHHVIFIDRLDQNITTLEHINRGEWKIRSMNPATTGLNKPPFAQETPLGIFLLQQKKSRMNFLKDGKNELAGYAPFASRFTGGAHIHGVPVNLPRTEMIEYSWTLGTTPRSHMCVRNATSHAKFIYDWAPTWRTLIIVIE